MPNNDKCNTTIVPLYMIEDASKFRVPGRRKTYIKMNNLATKAFQDYNAQGLAIISSRPACNCKDSGGRRFVKNWWDWVIETI